MSFNYISNLGSAINVFRTSLLKSFTAVAKPATAMPVRANISAQIYNNSVHITKQSFQTVTDLPNEIFRANSISEGAKLQKRYFDVLSPLFDNLEENYDHLMEAISKDDSKVQEKMQKIANIINASYSKINSLEKELNNDLTSIEKKAGTILESVKKKKEIIEHADSHSKALLYDEYSSELFNLSEYFGIEAADLASNNHLNLLLATNFSQQPFKGNPIQKNTINKEEALENIYNSETKFHKLCNLEDTQGKVGGIKYMQSFLGSLKAKLKETAQTLTAAANVSLSKKLIINAEDEKAGWEQLKSIGWLKIANKDSNLLLVVADNASEGGSSKSENELQIDLFKFADGMNVKEGKNKLQKSFTLKENDESSRDNFNNFYVSYKDALLSSAKQNLRDVREEVVGPAQKSAIHAEEAQMQFAQKTEKRENVIQNYLYTEFQRLKYMEMILPQIINSLNKINEAIYSAFSN